MAGLAEERASFVLTKIASSHPIFLCIVCDCVCLCVCVCVSLSLCVCVCVCVSVPVCVQPRSAVRPRSKCKWRRSNRAKSRISSKTGVMLLLVHVLLQVVRGHVIGEGVCVCSFWYVCFCVRTSLAHARLHTSILSVGTPSSLSLSLPLFFPLLLPLLTSAPVATRQRRRAPASLPTHSPCSLSTRSRGTLDAGRCSALCPTSAPHNPPFFFWALHTRPLLLACSPPLTCLSVS